MSSQLSTHPILESVSGRLCSHSRQAIQARMSSTRQAVTRSESFTGAGKVLARTFRQSVAGENGRSWERSTDWRTNPDAGSASTGLRRLLDIGKTLQRLREASRFAQSGAGSLSSWKISSEFLTFERGSGGRGSGLAGPITLQGLQSFLDVLVQGGSLYSLQVVAPLDRM